MTFKVAPTAQAATPESLYRVGLTKAVGVGPNQELVFGYTLEHMGPGPDLLGDDLRDIGAGILDSLSIPEDGLKVGKTYRAIMFNVTHDRETGMVEDWGLKLEEAVLHDTIISTGQHT